MKIAVLAANGRVGSLVVEEALRRGHEVTAFARRENRTKAESFVEKDIFDLKREDLEDFDAVVDAFGVFAEDKLYLHGKSLEHLSDILSGTGAHLYVVGGAGSLYMDESHTSTLSDGADFPEAFRPLAKAMGESLEDLRKRDDFKWTYISPAADFQAEGERTGKYLLAGEVFTVNDQGQSSISYADYAVAMVDQIEEGGHVGERISVLGA